MGTPTPRRRRLRRSARRTCTAALRAGTVAAGAGLALSGGGQRPGAVRGVAGRWVRGGAAGVDA